jgi:hypothetical protein
MRKSKFILLAALLLVSGCIYPFRADIESGSFDNIVVSGDITLGEQTRITLSYVYPLDASSSEMKKDYPLGTLVIENDSGGSWKGSYQYRGVYVFDTSSAPASGKYRLRITLNDGREYETPWTGVKQAPVITDFRYEGTDDGVGLFLSLDGADSLWNFRWDYTETWEYHADYIPAFLFVPGLPESDREDPEKIYREPDPSEINYTCWSTKSSIEPGLGSAEGQSDNCLKDVCFMTIKSTDIRISTLYSMLLNVRGISADALAWHRHMNAMSNESGSLFSPTPSEMRGNILCTTDETQIALGFVDVVCCVSRRIYVPNRFYHRAYDPELFLFFPEPDEDGNYNFDQLYITGDAPVRGEEPSLTGVEWGPKRCTDCTQLGGTTTEPEWWKKDYKP